MKNTLIFLISIILFVCLAPIGFIYAIITRPKQFAKYIYKVALTIDQSGNVVMQDLFNDVLRNGNGYKYGFEDETISSATGRNVLTGTLTVAGKGLNKFLNLIEKNHCVNSIGS